MSVVYFSEIKNKKQLPQGLKFESSAGFGQIDFFNSQVVRLRYDRNPLLEKHSYAVTGQPVDTPVKIEEQENFLTIRSKDLQLQLNSENACVSFYNANNALINQDALPVSWNGTEVTVCKKLIAEEHFVGLGEKTGPLDRRGHAYTNWNTDKFAYDVEQDPLYLSTPFYIGIHDGQVYGIFLDNTSRSTFNFGASTDRYSWFSADCGVLDYYFISANSIPELLQLYSDLTGRLELPPKWSLGFQQCRYSYYPDDEIRQLAQTFRAKEIPCDVIYLDIHYMEAYKAFTFDKQRFPQPKELVNGIRQQGFKTAVILDPGIKVEKGYSPYESGMDKDVFIKYPDKVNYTGEVWPGKCHFPDFTAPATRNWWADLMPFYTDLGVKGFWNDMNEPAAWGQCLPNFLEFSYEEEGSTHKAARNVYGMQMARATQQGVKQAQQDERPFILTRAGFCGIQRHAAVWTGDNVSSDEHLMLGVRLVNSLGLTGIANCGNDVGGFAGEASPALYARWISVGAFQPFFRAHSVVNSRDAEPWSFGEEVEQIARNYIQLRYQLMPTIYSLFWQATQTGLPVNRSLSIEFPHQEQVYHHEFQHQFMLGDSMLICPVESTKDYVKVWLPEGHWYNFWTGEQLQGNQELLVDCPIWKLPVFVKSGSILAMQAPCQHLDKQPDKLILHIYTGNEGFLDYYEDDGISYQYQQQTFIQRRISLDKGILCLEKAKGKYNSAIQKLQVVFHGATPPQVEVNRQKIASTSIEHRFVQPIEGVDTFYTDKGTDMKEDHLAMIELDYTTDEMKIAW